MEKDLDIYYVAMEGEESGLSAKDLKKKIYDSLKQKGLVDSLKSQLRNRLVSELQRTASQVKKDPKVAEERSLLLQASNSLVLDHMRRNSYEYSLSIFGPECGMTDDKVLTTRDLLELLHINPKSKLYRNLAKGIADCNKKGFLWHLIQELASSLGAPQMESQVQTEPIGLGALSTLNDKLDHVEEMYSSRKEGHLRHSVMQAEERILSYQRQLEERYRGDMKLELARFKEVELSRMRMEEREKCRKEIADARRDLEHTYKVKCDALAEREKHSMERLVKEQQIQEKDIYAQRQSILNEIELSRKRDRDLQREADNMKREKMLHEDRLKSLEAVLKKREKDLEQTERGFEDKLADEMNKFKIQEEMKYLERVKHLELLEKKTTEESTRLENEREKLKGISDELRVKTERLEQLERQLQDNKCELISLSKQNEVHADRMREMVDYKTVKEKNAALKTEVDYLKTCLSEEKYQKEQERQKHEDLLIKLTSRVGQPSPEFLSLQQELAVARERCKHADIELQHRDQQHEVRLKQEVDRNEELKKALEEQALQMKEMNNENVDLREQLLQTQNALRNEVYRKPRNGKPSSSVRRDSYGFANGQFDAVRPSSVQVRDLTALRDRPLLSSGQLAAFSDYPQTSNLPQLLGDTPVRLTEGAGGDINELLWDGYGTHLRCGSDSSQGDDELVQDAKHRLRMLEAEAENVTAAYRNFQHRLANPDSVLPDAPELMPSRLISADTLGPAPKSTLFTHYEDYRSPTTFTRPLSSTPFKGDMRNTVKARNNHSPPTQDGADDGAHLATSPDVSAVPQVSPLQEIKRVAPLTVDELGPKPLSAADRVDALDTDHQPSQVIQPVEHTRSDPQHTCPQLELRTVGHAVVGQGLEQAISRPDPEQTMMKHESKQVTAVHEPKQTVSLQEVKSEQTTTARLETEQERQEREDREWEEQRRRREEDRKRKQEEEFERAQRELEELKKKEEEEKRQQTAREAEDKRMADSEQLESVEKAESQEAGEEKQSTADEGIDPVMQKYMSMVQQQKQQEKKVAKSAVELWQKGKRPSQPDLSDAADLSEPDLSVADSVKSIEADDGEDFW